MIQRLDYQKTVSFLLPFSILQSSLENMLDWFNMCFQSIPLSQEWNTLWQYSLYYFFFYSLYSKRKCFFFLFQTTINKMVGLLKLSYNIFIGKKYFIMEWINFLCFLHWRDFKYIWYSLNQVCWDVILVSLKCTICMYRMAAFDTCIHSYSSYHNQDIDCFPYS